MTTGFLAYFEEMPDLSCTTIRVAEDKYDAREGSISQCATDAPNVFVFKRGEMSGNERGVFYFKRLRPLADCYELEKWLGKNRAKFPVTEGWGIVGEGHDCRTDIFGALLLQVFPEVTLYFLDIMGRFEDITANCRKLLEKMENQTESRDTNLFVNPDAIIVERILTKRVRIVLANRDVTRELPMRKIFPKNEKGTCWRCGTNLTSIPIMCPHCGRKNPPMNRTCVDCGKVIQERSQL